MGFSIKPSHPRLVNFIRSVPLSLECRARCRAQTDRDWSVNDPWITLNQPCLGTWSTYLSTCKTGCYQELTYKVKEKLFLTDLVKLALNRNIRAKLALWMIRCDKMWQALSFPIFPKRQTFAFVAASAVCALSVSYEELSNSFPIALYNIH